MVFFFSCVLTKRAAPLFSSQSDIGKCLLLLWGEVNFLNSGFISLLNFYLRFCFPPVTFGLRLTAHESVCFSSVSERRSTPRAVSPVEMFEVIFPK